MKRHITLYDLQNWDGADGRSNASSGMITASPGVADDWKRQGTGNSIRVFSGILIGSLDEIPEVRRDMERAAALGKLTPREREILGLGGQGMTLEATDGERLLARTQAAAFERCADIIVKNDDLSGGRVGQKSRFPHLLKMCEAGIAHAGTWPADKTGRWLGYVQGCLASRDLLDVNAERDLTREDFRTAYALLGHVPPATIDLESDGNDGPVDTSSERTSP